MAFSLWSPKLYGGPAETPKVPEIPKNFVEIPKIFDKMEMLTLFGDFEYFLQSLRICFEPNG
jgi:hypothetical protein